MSRGLHKAVNRFITTLKTSSAIDSSADFGTFEVQDITVGGFSLPQGNVRMYATVDFAQTGKEEIFRIKNVTGSVLTFDLRISVGGYNKPTHVGGASFRINDVSELVNDMGLHIDNCGFTEKIPGTQTIVVNGGNVNYKNVPYAVPTATLAITSGQLVDNSTNYVLLNLVTQAFIISATNTASGAITVASVVCSGGSLGTITDLRPAFNTTYEEIASKVDKAAGLRDSFGANKAIIVDPTSGAEVVKTSTVVSSISDTDVFITRESAAGNEKIVSYANVKNQLAGAGKNIKTVLLGEAVAGSTPTAMACIQNSIINDVVPTLTSNTGNPSYQVSFNNLSGSAFTVFDNNTGTSVTNGSGSQVWEVRIDMLSEVFLNGFSVGTGSGNVLYISTANAGFSIYGSNDGTIWTTLQSFSQDGSGNISPSSFPSQSTSYSKYKIGGTTNSWGVTLYQWNFGFRYSNQNGAIPLTVTLGSNVAGVRLKSGITFKTTVTDTLGRVYTGQNATSASARIQLLNSAGTLITEKTPGIGTDYADFTDSITKDVEYIICVNDTTFFNSQSNELTLVTYKAGNPFCMSGYLNGDKNVIPQSIRRIDFGTVKAMKAGANTSDDYSLLSGFVIGPKSLCDVVSLDSNEGSSFTGFTGLSVGSTYYITNTLGTIGTTAGTKFSPIGYAASSATIIIGKFLAASNVVSYSTGTSGTSSSYYHKGGLISFYIGAGGGDNGGSPWYTGTTNLETSLDGTNWSVAFSLSKFGSGVIYKSFSQNTGPRYFRYNMILSSYCYGFGDIIV